MKQTLISSLICAGLLTACASNNPNDKFDFKSERPANKTSLEVPPDLSQPTAQDRYPLPTVSAAQNQLNQQAASGKTTSQVAVTGTAKAAIERAGSQRWIAIQDKSPAEVWPLLKAFWQDNGFVIDSEDPEVGVMETDWAENRAKLGASPIRGLLESAGLGSLMSTPERDRFRIRLEKTASGTEVFFSHRGMYEIYIDEGKDQTRWQPRPSDPELEAVFLSRFLVRLGMDEAAAAQATAKPATVAASRARLSDGTVLLDESFDRAWRRVGLVLEHNGVTITDRDRSLGVFFVTFNGDETQPANRSEPGLLDKLAFWKDTPASNTPSSKAALRVQITTIADKQVKIELRPEGNAPVLQKQKDSLLQSLIKELS